MGKIVTGEEYLGEGVPTFEIYTREDFEDLRRLTIKMPIKVVIKADIDMKGEECDFEPIDMSYFNFPILVIGSKAPICRWKDKDRSDNKYKISNMVVMLSETGAGLFASTRKTITFKDIIFENCIVMGSRNVGTAVGHADEVNIQNCTVINCDISGSVNTGAFVGNCRNFEGKDIAINSHVEGNRNTGAVVGKVSKKAKLSNVDVESFLTLNGEGAHDIQDEEPNVYVGLGASVSVSKCTNMGVQVVRVPISGFKIYAPRKRNKK